MSSFSEKKNHPPKLFVSSRLSLSSGCFRIRFMFLLPLLESSPDVSLSSLSSFRPLSLSLSLLCVSNQVQLASQIRREKGKEGVGQFGPRRSGNIGGHV